MAKIETVSWEQIRREKVASRKADWDRIARGEATPEEIQRENSFLPDDFAKHARILNLKQVFKFYSRSYRRDLALEKKRRSRRRKKIH